MRKLNWKFYVTAIYLTEIVALYYSGIKYSDALFFIFSTMIISLILMVMKGSRVADNEAINVCDYRVVDDPSTGDYSGNFSFDFVSRDVHNDSDKFDFNSAGINSASIDSGANVVFEGDDDKGEVETEKNDVTDDVIPIVQRVKIRSRRVNSTNILVGHDSSTGKEVYVEYMSKDESGNFLLSNKMSIITGSSGQGKTFLGNTIMKGVSGIGIPVIAADMSNSFTDRELLDGLKSSCDITHHLLSESPLPIDVFKPLGIGSGSPGETMLIEGSFQTASRVANLFSSTFGLGGQQYALLIDIIERGIEEHGDGFTFSTLDELLSCERNSTAVTVLNKVRPLIKAKAFQERDTGNNWASILGNGSDINIMSLDSLVSSKDTAALVVNFMFADFYNYMVLTHNANDPVMMIAAEAQELDFSKSSALDLHLRQGRKFGIMDVLDFQMMSTLSPYALSILDMAATRFHFKTGSSDTGVISKMLERAYRKDSRYWASQLESCGVGECIVSTFDKEKGTNTARKIKVLNINE